MLTTGNPLTLSYWLLSWALSEGGVFSVLAIRLLPSLLDEVKGWRTQVLEELNRLEKKLSQPQVTREEITWVLSDDFALESARDEALRLLTLLAEPQQHLVRIAQIRGLMQELFSDEAETSA